MFRWGGGKSSKFIRNDIRSLRVGVIIRVEWLKFVKVWVEKSKSHSGQETYGVSKNVGRMIGR